MINCKSTLPGPLATRDENDFLIAARTLSDHSASQSDVTDVVLTWSYVNNMREFLLLGDKPYRREHHILQCKHPSQLVNLLATKHVSYNNIGRYQTQTIYLLVLCNLKSVRPNKKMVGHIIKLVGKWPMAGNWLMADLFLSLQLYTIIIRQPEFFCIRLP